MLWLRQQASPPGSITPFNPFGGAVALGDGAYTATVDAGAVGPLDQQKILDAQLVQHVLGSTSGSRRIECRKPRTAQFRHEVGTDS